MKRKQKWELGYEEEALAYVGRRVEEILNKWPGDEKKQRKAFSQTCGSVQEREMWFEANPQSEELRMIILNRR